MKKVLGIDLGTNSIGWSLVGKNEEVRAIGGVRQIQEHYGPLEKGVLIFSEGVKNEKGNESSKAAERTSFRAARRLKFRRKLRKYETLKVLIKNGMCPLSLEELEHWRQSTNPLNGKKQSFKNYPENPEFRSWLNTDNEEKNPYFMRAKALDEGLTGSELGRVFYHLAQRRGFLSNRLDNQGLSVLEEQQPALYNLIDHAASKVELVVELEDFFEGFDLKEDEYKELAKLKRAFDGILKNNEDQSVEALSERLLARLNRKENLGAVKKGIVELTDKIQESGSRSMGEYFYRCINEGVKIRSQYTAREAHYLEEFNLICEIQNIESELKKALHKAIFFQRPLRSQKGLVGKCTLEPTKARCPVSHPYYEEFRMLAFVNNIRIKTPEDEGLRPLNDTERKKAIAKCHRKKNSFPFVEIAQAIAPKGSFGYYRDRFGEEKPYTFNYQMNAGVPGCPTRTVLKSVFSCEPDEISIKYEVNKRDGRVETRKLDAHGLWHVLFSFDSQDILLKYAKEKLGLDAKKALQFSRATLKKDYSSLSLKAIRKTLPQLREGIGYDKAVFSANLSEIVDTDKWKESENLLKNEVFKIIDSDKEERKRAQLANDIYEKLKDDFGKQHKDYSLDEIDKQTITSKLNAAYGEKYLSKLSIDEKEEIEREISAKVLSCLQSGRFIKHLRIDDRIKAFIEDNNLCSNPDRLAKLYHPSDIETYKGAVRSADGKLYLNSPMTNSIRNPMAMRSLHQLRKLINTLIREDIIDEETEIHIELARELNDANKRKAIQIWQKNREAAKEQHKKEIVNLFFKETGQTIVPSEGDLLKYKLYLEQDKKCLYTNKGIRVESFLGPDPYYDIEHTIPRSISQDNSEMNITLCDSKYNREVKKNRIPADCPNHEEILDHVAPWGEKVKALEYEINEMNRRVKGAATKEAKDVLIQRRHLLRFEYNYWKRKHQTFTMTEVKTGFKNSQGVDIGIISKYARAYLKSVFTRVLPVKGALVAEFRKAWGLHDYVVDEKGERVKSPTSESVLKPKDRSNHIHHCQDATVIACMSKRKYDVIAKFWRLQEKGHISEAKALLNQTKPWKTFAEDVRGYKDEVLVVHHYVNNVGKAAKKKWRKRGKIVRNNNGDIIYLKGDAVRGSLHKDFFYGAVKLPQKDKATGNLIIEGGEPVIKKFYVRRDFLSNLKDADLKHIVDDRVREIVIKARTKEKELKEVISKLKTEKVRAEENVQEKLDLQIAEIEHEIEHSLYVIPPKDQKGRPNPIKKVRLFRPTVTDPIFLKQHSHPSRHKHKQHMHVMNDENHLFLIYEGNDKKGNVSRKAKIVNLLDAHARTSVDDQFEGRSLRDSLTKGTAVLFYQNHPDELKSLSQKKLVKRLYQVVKFDKNGRLWFRYHSEAKPAKELNEKYTIDPENPFEQIRLTSGHWNFVSEGEAFALTRSGRLIFNF